MTLQDLAVEAAAHWQGRPTRLILNRENAVFEMAIPGGRAALRLHRMGYQNDAAIASELCGARLWRRRAWPFRRRWRTIRAIW